MSTASIPVVSPPRQRTPQPSARYVFIDGLRGIAAMAVVILHLAPGNTLGGSFHEMVPDWFFSILEHGHLGVPVFFVLSGFVIAHSQRGIRVTPRFLGNFALRRSLRLDPPYWATIAITILIGCVLNHLRPERAENLPNWPGWGSIGAHVLYLQDILGSQPILGVFWTLCYEVQFYLALTIFMGVCQRLPLWNRRLLGFQHGSELIVFGILALVSMAAWTDVLYMPRGVFLHLWFSFYLGVLICRVFEKSVSVVWLWIYLGLMIACTVGYTVFSTPSAEVHGLQVDKALTYMLTGVAIYAAGSLNKMGSWLSSGWIQFLGKISYSIYLIHYPVGVPVISLGARYHYNSKILVVAWILAAIAISILMAYILFLCCERPGVNLGKRLKRRPPESVPVPSAAVP